MTLFDVDNTGYASSRALRRAFERRAEPVPESVWRRFAPPASRVMSRRFSYGASDCSATGPECPQHAARLRRNALPGVAAKATRAAPLLKETGRVVDDGARCISKVNPAARAWETDSPFAQHLFAR